MAAYRNTSAPLKVLYFILIYDFFSGAVAFATAVHELSGSIPGSD